MQLQEQRQFAGTPPSSLSSSRQQSHSSNQHLDGAYPAIGSSDSSDKMQQSHPHLQSPYQTRSQPLPSSGSSSHAGGAFHVRDLQQSLDEPSNGRSSSSSNGHNDGGWSNGRLNSNNPAFAASSTGRDSPSKAAALANRMQNLSSPPPAAIPAASQGYSNSANGHASTSTPSARSSGATATPNSATPGPASARSRNPLIDLIDTEKGYVEDLGLVIKVSARQP